MVTWHCFMLKVSHYLYAGEIDSTLPDVALKMKFQELTAIYHLAFLCILLVSRQIPNHFTTASHNTFTREECFIIMLYHLNEGTPFTAMTRGTIGGNSWYFSIMFEQMINHLSFAFYNKISGTSMQQCIPRYLDSCHWLIFNSLSVGAIWDVEY